MTETQTTVKTNEPKKETIPTPKNKALKGFLIWGIVFSGYLLFCFNWMVMDNMKGVAGVSGWYGSFFSETPGSLVDQAPNWTLTFMRGVGAFFAGWVLVKVGHKYSVTIALGLLCVGIIAPWTGGTSLATDENKTFMFILFLILRMCMAVGATTLIVYTQPIIATYMNEGQKSTANLFNSLAFNFGSIFAIAIVGYGLKSSILAHWQIFTSSVSAIAVILLILWIVFAEKIATPNDPKDKATYAAVLKEKNTIFYSIMFGLWLTWVVLYLTMIPGYFLTPLNNEGISLASNDGNQIIATWKIMFLLGLVIGIPIYNWLAKQNFARKPIAMGSILIGVVLTIITSLIGGYWLDGTTFASVMFLLTSLLAGIFAWGVQGYMLGTTYHYKGVTPKKQGIMIGSCWGIGYMGETLLTILSSAIDSLVRGGGEKNVTSAWVFMVVFLVYCFGCAAMWIFIPETHGKNPSKLSIHANN